MESYPNSATFCSNRLNDLKSFEDTKAGVQGLVQNGVVTVPQIFIRPPDELAEEEKYSRGTSTSQIPVIDLSGLLDPKKR